ncbi:MAG: alpha-galactosidase [Clostridia bacterium]|nr:alpha-galactosidase [Clostridia bacterium]
MINYDSQNKIFYLNAKNTTYAIGLTDSGLVAHLYWGKRVNFVPKADPNRFGGHSYSAFDYGDYCSNTVPQEYPAFGNADFRIPAVRVSSKLGHHVKLQYKDYEIVDGKPKIPGLPATYVEESAEAQTLKLYLSDDVQQIEVVLYYTVFENFDAIARHTEIKNLGEAMELNGAMSACVDFYGLPESRLITLDGNWANERVVTDRKIVSGNQNVESRCGVSSAYHNPFMAVCDEKATETAGNVYGFSLVYSGDFTAGVELDSYRSARAYIGINPFEFTCRLETGDVFATPEAVLVYSAEGFGAMSRTYHDLYRTRLCRGKYRDTERFALINNWEATYFDFNEEKIVAIAEKAATIGVDTMVLDDGWFGKRLSDNAGLGDWVENPDRLPNGLKGLAEKVNACGMRFGLWFEPEMVNPDSDLHRAHPDWIIHTENRNRSLMRNQSTLDLSRKDVCDYIIDAVSSVLRKANIQYVKWDMNRYMTEVGSALLPAERAGEVKHRYMLGLYRVLETITTQFPDVLFESCASGGSRFDPGMLHYMPQTWTSDDSDAEERLKIQYGTSMVYPYSSMGAHVSACPNHQIGRTTSFEMRCNVALPGQFGFAPDLNRCTEKALEIAQEKIKQYRALGPVFHSGDCYRLKSPFETDWSVVQFVSKDQKTAVVCVNSAKATCNAPDEFVALRGLKHDATYCIDGTPFDSEYLMNTGIHLRNGRENQSFIMVLELV